MPGATYEAEVHPSPDGAHGSGSGADVGVPRETPRLPLEPLRSHIARTLGQKPEDTSADQLAEQCQVSDRTWTRWQTAGGIDVWTADKLATLLGEHPCAIWDCGNGDWADAADAEADRVEAERAARRPRRNTARPSRSLVDA